MLNCWSTAPGRLIDTPTLRARGLSQALDHLSQQKYFGQCWNCFRPISIADRVETAKLCQKACMLVGPGMKSAFSSHSPLWFALPPSIHTEMLVGAQQRKSCLLSPTVQALLGVPFAFMQSMPFLSGTRPSACKKMSCTRFPCHACRPGPDTLSLLFSPRSLHQN